MITKHCASCDYKEVIAEGEKPKKFTVRTNGYIYKHCNDCVNKSRREKSVEFMEDREAYEMAAVIHSLLSQWHTGQRSRFM